MAEPRSIEVVPGMADAIEKRRKDLGMSPGEFAAAAGLTAPGLAPVRKGYRRAYQDKVKLGVARALEWPVDAVDRLLAGERVEPDPPTTPGGAALPPDEEFGFAALDGEKLTDEEKRAAIAVVRALRAGRS